jgi:hypothetical protein
MILSNVEIHRAIDEGNIIIEPEPQPRLPTLQNPNSPYDTTAVNLRLSRYLSVCKKPQPLAFDLRQRGLARIIHDGASRSVFSAVRTMGWFPMAAERRPDLPSSVAEHGSGRGRCFSRHECRRDT